MKIVKECFNIIIAFILTILIVLNFIIMFVSNTILNKNYVLSRLEKSNYYEKIEIDLRAGFEEYQYQSGLPGEVFENLCSQDIVKQDINLIIASIYERREIVNSSQIVEQRISENINKYLAQNNIILNSQQQENIDEFQGLIVDVYEERINIFENFEDRINQVIVKCRGIVDFVQKVLGVILIIFIIILIIFNLKNIGVFINLSGIGLLASGGLLICFKLIIDKNIDINNILLFSENLSYLLKDVIFDILDKMNFYGIVLVMIGIIAIIVGNNLKNNKSRYLSIKKD